MDKLYESVKTPYSDRETEAFILNPEASARTSLERIHCHNYSLIQSVAQWSGFLANKLPRPSADLPRLLVPGRNAENDAITNLEALTDFFSRYPHGSTPRFSIFVWASRSTFTLVDALANLHDTEHLHRVRKSFDDIVNLIAYKGEPRFSREDFSARLAAARQDFISECMNNASCMALWLNNPKKDGPDASVSLSQRRDVARSLAIERMTEYYNSGMTWSEAEEKVHAEMWRKFNALGLACAKHNFHSPRYRK